MNVKRTVISLFFAATVLSGCGKSPDELYSEALSAQEDGKAEEAISQYENLIEEHPQSQLAPKAQFMIGRVSETILKDYKKAKTEYQETLDSYPNSAEADSAGIAIEQMAITIFSEGQRASVKPALFSKAEELLNTFLELYPNHSSCDSTLLTLARIAQNKGDAKKAISMYNQLLDKYPNSRFGYQSQFMIGFVYEEMLNDHENAKLAYQKVIDNYPDSDLADDAEVMLAHIGRDPEEWIDFQAP